MPAIAIAPADLAAPRRTRIFFFVDHLYLPNLLAPRLCGLFLSTASETGLRRSSAGTRGVSADMSFLLALAVASAPAVVLHAPLVPRRAAGVRPGLVPRCRYAPLFACESETSESERRDSNLFEDVWSKYVLIRPGWKMDELKQSTKLRTARTWSWEERTPGTARTIVLSAAVIVIVAIPYLVIPYLLEFAALSVSGVTPQEYFAAGSSDVASNVVGALGELGRVIADALEWLFAETAAY